MDENNSALLIIGAVILFLIAAFWLGFNAASALERNAHNRTKKTLWDIQRQKVNLTKWVRGNWPNEFEAYRRGHQEGYQQGVLQAADIEEETRE